MELPRDLRDALDAAVAGSAARAAVERLIAVYRAAGPATAPILASVGDVAAYAAYRMPATYAAVRTVLAQLRRAAPELAPRTQLDLGGGTGAAAWAAAAEFATLAEVTVVDQVEAALSLGRRLAEQAECAAVRKAQWRHARLDAAAPGDALPGADLVTVSYVLNELSAADQRALVTRAADLAAVLVLVEPGTPAGFARIRAARAQLIEAGLTVLAPCPHQDECPIAALPEHPTTPGLGRPGAAPGGPGDWCHFAARVSRSAAHRRLKGGELSYEDEKFAYVAARRGGELPATRARVLRRPDQRKGMVSLTLCTGDRGVATEIVSKRQGERYRAARDLAWGDPFA